MGIFDNVNWGLNAHPSDAPAYWGLGPSSNSG